MFRQLINEAIITLEIEVESPLMIGAGNTNVMDPSLPDNQVVKRTKNGREEPYIPGSSLKGLFRSRAEQLLAGMGYQVDEPFNFRSDSNQAKGDGKTVYKASCPVSKLFGSLGMKSRIQFADAQPNSETIHLGVRNGVAINRVTGGAKGAALFDVEVVESGTFVAKITLSNYELYHLSLVMWLIRDLDDGYIKLGSSTSRGLGKVKAKIINTEVRSYSQRSESDYISGALYENEDRSSKKVAWQKDLFGWKYDNGNMEDWIGAEGLLTDGPKWPDK